MRRFILAAAMVAVAVPTMPALSRDNDHDRGRGKAEREYRKDVNKARKEYRKDVKEARKDRREAWREYSRYDYNRVDPRYGNYRPERYYRDGNYYQPRRLSYNDRIYRGADNRYYCRRSDGTTGLIIGGIAGGVLGNVIAPGGSKTLGTLLGGGAGALIGRAIDRDNVTCR